eukprot:9030889-Pyramimonas_sp.AAC.1
MHQSHGTSRWTAVHLPLQVANQIQYRPAGGAGGGEAVQHGQAEAGRGARVGGAARSGHVSQNRASGCAPER